MLSPLPRQPVRALIDARLIPGTVGGVEQGCVSLARGWTDLSPSGMSRTWLVWKGHEAWLQPHVGAHDDILEIAPTASHRAWMSASSRLKGFMSYGPIRKVRTSRAIRVETAWSGLSEVSEAFDVVHFPLQRGFVTRKPNVYQPHDIQHEHLPGLFSPEDLALRKARYALMLGQATRIIVGTTWTARDLEATLGVDPLRIDVVPLAAPRLPDLSTTSESVISVQGQYAVYPAAAWPHKNHARLIEAVASLRQSGLDLELVLPGCRGPEETRIRRIAATLLGDAAHFPGYLSRQELSDVIRRADLLVIPSLFESESLPIWEAFQCDVPVAAAAAGAIPDQVLDSATLFDPLSVEDIAAAMSRAIKDGSALVPRGRQRVKKFNERLTALGTTVSLFRATGAPAPPWIEAEWAEAPIF